MFKYMTMFWCAVFGFDLAMKNLSWVGVPMDVFMIILFLAAARFFNE